MPLSIPDHLHPDHSDQDWVDIELIEWLVARLGSGSDEERADAAGHLADGGGRVRGQGGGGADFGPYGPLGSPGPTWGPWALALWGTWAPGAKTPDQPTLTAALCYIFPLQRGVSILGG